MRDHPNQVTALDVAKHFVTGAGLGAFLALSLVVQNQMLFENIRNSMYPRLAMGLFTGCTIAFFGVGSAISGFILTSIQKAR